MTTTRLARGIGVLALGIGGLGAGLALAGPAGATVTGFDPPPPGGTGGFYLGGNPTTVAPTGASVSLVVTVVQDTNQTPDGSITLSWNPADFTSTDNGSDASGVCTSSPGTLTCTYTDLAHQYKSVAFGFTTVGPDPNATINATAQTDGAPFGPYPFTLAITNVPTTKDQCKQGNWAQYTVSSGRFFKNQGACVSFVATGGRNSAAG